MACKPLDSGRKRATVVRPPRDNTKGTIAPLIEDLVDLEDEERNSDGGVAETDDKWEELANKYENLEKKVHEYLQEESKADGRELPIVKFPPKMTKEEWDRHQVTHTHHMHRAASIARQQGPSGDNIPRNASTMCAFRMWTAAMRGPSRYPWTICTWVREVRENKKVQATHHI